MEKKKLIFLKALLLDASFNLPAASFLILHSAYKSLHHAQREKEEEEKERQAI